MTNKTAVSKTKAKATFKPANPKQLLRKAVISGGVVFAIFSIISYSLYQKQNEITGYSTLISGAIFACVAAARVIYDINQWSLAVRTMVHLLVMIVTIYPLLLTSNWFPINSVIGAWLFLVPFALIGEVVWLIGWLICAGNSPLRRKK